MIAWAKSRFAFSSPRDWVSESQIEIGQARLLVLRAARLMDKSVNKAAHVDVSATKFVAGRMQTRGLDRAIQVFGAAGSPRILLLPVSGPGAARCAPSTDRARSTRVGIARRDERAAAEPCRQTHREFK